MDPHNLKQNSCFVQIETYTPKNWQIQKQKRNKKNNSTEFIQISKRLIIGIRVTKCS